MTNRRIQSAGKLHNFFPCIRHNHTAAAINAGTFCLFHQLHRLCNFLFGIFPCNFGNFHRRLRRKPCLFLLDILRNINQNRLRSARCRNGIRLSDILHARYTVAVLDNPIRQAEYIHLLKIILPNQRCGHIPRNDNQRNRIQISCRNPRYQVRCARAGGRQHHARFTCCSGISIRRMNPSLLMGGQYMTNPSLVSVNLLI